MEPPSWLEIVLAMRVSDRITVNALASRLGVDSRIARIEIALAAERHLLEADEGYTEWTRTRAGGQGPG